MKKIFLLLAFLLIAAASRAQSLPCPAGSTCGGSVTFTVNFQAPPAPASVSPSSAAAGSASAVTVTLAAPAGGTFNSTMTVQWCQITPSPCATATALTTAFVSTSSLTAVIPVAQLASSGTFAMYLAQPSGGHAQNAAPNEILGPAADKVTCKTCATFGAEVLTTVDSVRAAKG
jgi:hypothetical protein